MLENEYFYIPELNVTMYGIDDCLIGNGDPSVLLASSVYTFNLVACHEPDIFDEALDYNVSLMLSGHTHGGRCACRFSPVSFCRLTVKNMSAACLIKTEASFSSPKGSALPNCRSDSVLFRKLHLLLLIKITEIKKRYANFQHSAFLFSSCIHILFYNITRVRRVPES